MLVCTQTRAGNVALHTVLMRTGLQNLSLQLLLMRKVDGNQSLLHAGVYKGTELVPPSHAPTHMGGNVSPHFAHVCAGAENLSLNGVLLGRGASRPLPCPMLLCTREHNRTLHPLLVCIGERIPTPPCADVHSCGVLVPPPCARVDVGGDRVLLPCASAHRGTKDITPRGDEEHKGGYPFPLACAWGAKGGAACPYATCWCHGT